mgnify:CR=1 FL=1
MTTHDEKRETLRAALEPKSVAVIGASENPNKIGGRPIHYLQKHGFRGLIYPVNPKRSELQGLTAYPDVLALPDTPDVAIIAVPGDAAVDAVEACADAGVKVAVVMTSGFGEVDAIGGKAKEARMRAAAHAAGMRIVGPNSQGLANFGTGAVLSFSTMYLEMPPQDGPVAVVSQSGAMSGMPYALLRARGLGVRHSHATGNDCDVTAAELASVVAEDPDIRLLLLYLESIADAGPLAQLAEVARSRGLPVVALKSGRSAAGQEAARSHTGALANEDRVVDAFFERHGIWRAQSSADLVAAAEMYLKGWRPRGRRLVVISNSGAVCVMAADAATQAGLPMARLAPDTLGRLKQILPSCATATNPVDITAALLTNSRLFSDILPVLARDAAADAVAIGIPVAGQGYDLEAFARDTASFVQQTGRPTAVSASQAVVANPFRAQGLPVFATEGEAVGALAQFLSHMELMRTAQRAGSPVRAGAAGEGRRLNEAASLALAARFGVPVVDHRLCQDESQAVAALAEFGAPVVLKGCSEAVVHKSELGIVRLRLGDAAAVSRAFGEVRDVMARRGLPFEGAIVARTARGRRELMLGGRIDPAFGPVVIVGDGGKYVEAMPDARVLLWPFDEEEVLRALTRLRIAPLFAGVRDEPALDAAAFAQATMAVGRLLDEGGVVNLDLNPVLTGARGEGCVALDAVVYRR